MKKLYVILLASLYAIPLIAQTTHYAYNGKWAIELPAKLELQASELNTIKPVNQQGKNPQVNISTPSSHIKFQQKGLNADVKAAYNKYCRVIIEYFKESRNDPTFGRGDQIVVDRDLLYAVTEASKEACERSGTPFMKLISVQPLTINDFPVLYYSYKRKGWEGKQPPVIVNVYNIFNRYESVTLAFSYREAEREAWRDIHNYIIKSFSFTKKY